MEETIVETIQKYHMIESGDKLVLGVSGGPDSICMLDVLYKLQKQLDFEISVAHINHGIRKEAMEDEQYVEDYCKKREIPFFAKRVEVLSIAKDKKMGTEEAGREVRYQFFEEVLQKTGSNKIATAHTANDNAETILMNLLRGCGLSGLKGIEPMRDHLIRPIIECERKQVEAYCDAHHLLPRMDATNQENIYTRNRIRNRLIPYLQKEFNPNIIETLNRLSMIVKEENDYLTGMTREKFGHIVLEENQEQVVFDLKEFNKLELVIKKRIIRYTINKLLRNSARNRKSAYG